jgi:hypothetical protein
MIAEFQFGTGALGAVLGPERGAEVADIVAFDSTGETVSVGMWLGDGNGVRESLADADSATGVYRTATDDGRVLYRVDYDESFAGSQVYRTTIESGGLFVSGSAGPSAWTLRLRFPDRAAVSAARERCDALGLDVGVEILSEDRSTRRADRLGVTEAQRQALTAAAEQGYFEVPRRTSLSGLAADLDVSSQATSERLRRGLDSLVSETLLDADRSDR